MKTTERTILLEIALQTILKYPEFVQDLLDINNGELADLFDSINHEVNEDGENKEHIEKFAGKFYSNIRKKRFI